MKKLITNRPDRQNVRKINARNGAFFKPYGLQTQTAPGGSVDPSALLVCLEDRGWTPDTTEPENWYFPQVDAWLTKAQAQSCDIAHLPSSLEHDVRECLENQGGCQ